MKPSPRVALRLLPHLITSLRLVAIPILLFFLANERYTEALSTFVLAGMTDWLDGWMARYVGSDSEEFGKRFDALADKALVGSALLSLTVMGSVPGWLTGLVLIRDVALVGGFGGLFLWTGQTIRTKPTQFGKWGTFLLLVTVILALIDLRTPSWLPSFLIQTLWALAGVTITVSAGQYLCRAIAWLQEQEQEQE
jgi:cardiolipin synthase